MKIMATIDFSTTSESVLQTAAIYAKTLNAEVFLVHAEPEQPSLDDEERDLTPETIRLKKNASALKRVGIQVTPIFLKGPVCKTLLEEASRIGADLIITGAHGHGGAQRKIPVGSISASILLQSKIPVLVIPTER